MRKALKHWALTLLIMLAPVALAPLTGCAENEKKEVQVTHEEHEGEVRDVGPGEMIVE